MKKNKNLHKAKKEKIKLYRGPLKWAGGKYRLLPSILPFIPVNKNFYDVFGGSAVVSRNVATEQKIIVNDLNTDLYNFYYWLKKDFQKLIKIARPYFDDKYCNVDSYNQIKNKFNLIKEDLNIERAALFLVLNKFGFNGMCRYNQKGEFNIPCGSKIKQGKLPRFPENELIDFGVFFQQKKIKIINESFEKVLDFVGKDDCAYCDPPYWPISETASFTSYTKEGFNKNKQIELANKAKEASKRGALVIISNNDLKETRELYKEAKIIGLSSMRSIAANGEKRLKTKEILAIFGEK